MAPTQTVPSMDFQNSNRLDRTYSSKDETGYMPTGRRIQTVTLPPYMRRRLNPFEAT